MIGPEYLNNLYYIRDLDFTNYGEASLIVKSTIHGFETSHGLGLITHHNKMITE